MGTMRDGLHFLHLQVAESAQGFGPTRSYLFMKMPEDSIDMGQLSYHCWLDQDFEHQQVAPLGNGAFLMDVAELRDGLHFVHVMLEGEALTSTRSYLFMKAPVDSIDMSQLSYHCWFDYDFENQLVDSLGNGLISLDVSDLRDGLHFVHVMLEGEALTTTRSYLFMKTTPPEPSEDWQYHCWFNQDHETMQSGMLGSGVFLLDASALSVGQHTMIMQLDNGTLTPAQSYIFYRMPMISVAANPTEGGTATFQIDDMTCTLTATPNEGYDFVNWTVNGTAASTASTYSFTMTEDATYVANFALKTYDITAAVNPTEGGTVEGTGTYNHFSTCTLTATASTGYHFVNWTHVGEVISNLPTYSFTVTGAGDYVANFALKTYDITAEANPTAGGTVEGTGVYQHFSTCTLTATANTGCHFVNWTLVGEVVSNSPTYTFTVTDAGDYVANFEINSYDITVAANPEAGGSVTGAGSYNHFSTCTLTATANKGYTFINWTLGGEVVSNSPTYSFEVTGAASYVANFELNIYTITATVSPTAGGTVAGSGIYDYGTTCTLTATPNTGYHFVNWTLVGEVVSDSPTYSFEVTGDADYIAHFELNTYDITATANPTAGGTVTGAGTYAHGATCTLTATANEGYVFAHWTEGGTVVSESDTYSFTATENRDLSANFVSAYHWDVDPHSYPNTMTMVGIVRIDGEEQTVGTLEIGAFCDGECRGRERLTGQYYPSYGHYFVFLTVYGEDGDEIGFMLYDQTLDAELDLVCASMAFGTNVTYGNPSDPYVFDFSSPQAEVTQTTAFAQGWNWWSTYIEADDLFGQLKTGLGANASQIKSSTSFVNYFSGMWIGGLNSISNESCYLIKANNACTFEMTGNQATPANHPITINPNWNWIGYPNTGAQSVINAFSNFAPANGDQVKSQNSFSTYYGNMWIGGLNTITPGMGLLYKSNSTGAVTLVYPEPNRAEELVENVTNESNHWAADYHAYPSNMTVMAVVELDDEELSGENYELAAFANGECRGSAKLMYVEPLNRYVVFLTVVGDEASELRFSLYDSETGMVETQSIASLQYETNAIVGSLETPYVIRFRSTTGVDEWANSVNIFPNPVNCGEQFSLGLPAVETLHATSVQIVNAMGVVVETLRATSVPAHITAPKVAGVYTLRITVEGKGFCFRKLVVK